MLLTPCILPLVLLLTSCTPVTCLPAGAASRAVASPPYSHGCREGQVWSRPRGECVPTSAYREVEGAVPYLRTLDRDIKMPSQDTLVKEVTI